MKNTLFAAGKICLAFLLFALLPTIIQAQNFKPDLPEDRWLYLFKGPSSRGGESASLTRVLFNEQVRVDNIDKNGWCRVYFKDSQGKEFNGYTKIGVLIPLDEEATEMKAAYDKQGGLEKLVITLGLILVVVGLVLSFLSFLGHIRTMLLAAIVLLISAVEIYFLTQTSGFSFYLPSAVGWKWAAISFVCFTVFLLVQIYLFMMTLKCITPKQEVVGNSILIPLLGVLGLFVALLVTLFTAGKGEDLIFKIFVGIQAANIVFVLIYSIVKIGLVRGLFYTIVFAAGIAAIGFMARDVIAVAVVGLFGLFFVQFIFTKYGEGSFTQVRVKDSSGRERYRWGDEVKPGDEVMP